MPALEPLAGPARRRRSGGARRRALGRRRPRRRADVVLRFAPDEALAIGATGVTLDDPDAIVEDERGYVGAWCPFDAIRGQTEWAPPCRSAGPRPGLDRRRAGQGLAAGRR